jgi:hypothetical protein
MAEDILARLRAHSIRTLLGVENVRLAYRYWDMGDLDGYASLLHECVVADAPDRGRCRRTPTLLRRVAEQDDPTTRHRIDRTLADGATVVVIGRLVGEPGRETAFVDLVGLSDDCLLTSLNRYFADVPGPPGPNPPDDSFPHNPITE